MNLVEGNYNGEYYTSVSTTSRAPGSFHSPSCFLHRAPSSFPPSLCCRRPHRGTPKPPFKSPKPSSSPPSTLDALKDDADPAFYPPSFEEFAEFKGSAFRESIESLEEMANREPYHGSSFGPSVHPSDTVFASEPRQNNGREKTLGGRKSVCAKWVHQGRFAEDQNNWN